MTQRFLAALVYFTRIPWPTKLHADASKGASSFAPLIGCIVAAFSIFVAWLATMFFPAAIVVVMMMVSAVWITGALHEDGWSDFCDGFGGGWTRERVLEIMRDSRAGVYGVVGLLCLLSLKFLALLELFRHTSLEGGIATTFILVIFTGHSLSRFTAVSLMFTQDYVSSETPGRARAMSARLEPPEFLFACFTGLAPLVVLMAVATPMAGLALIPVLCARTYLARLFMLRLGGYTGDCLGAVQQVSETVLYLTLLVLLAG